MGSTEPIISFVKKASRRLFAFQLLKGLIFSVGVLEILACVLLAASNFSSYFVRSNAISTSVIIALITFIICFFILLFRKPSLEKVVRVVDYRCGLEQRLVTAWEFQKSNALFVPLLIDDLAPRLNNISRSTYAPFHFKKSVMIFFFSISVIFGISINSKIPKKKINNKEFSHISSQMNMMADALKELEKKENAQHSELSAVMKAAEQLKNTEKLLSDGNISKEEAAKEISDIKEELMKSEPEDAENDKNSPEIDLGEGAMDTFFYKLMDTLDKINVFDRKGVLKDILKVLDSFETKLSGRKNKKNGTKGKVKVSKQKTQYTKTMYINMDTKKAKKLGLIENKIEKDNNKELDFYKNYISSTGRMGELSFVEKKLVIDYFDKLNKD